ncbi:twin-arginine translocase TatA/TatE family subunit [Thermaurantiacus sp.]
MGSMSIWHWVIVGLVVLVLFGRGRISEMMGDFGKGIKAFRKGLSEDEAAAQGNAAREAAARPLPQVTAEPAASETRTADPSRQG